MEVQSSSLVSHSAPRDSFTKLLSTLTGTLICPALASSTVTSTVPMVAVPPAALVGTARTAADVATIAAAERAAIVLFNGDFIFLFPFKNKSMLCTRRNMHLTPDTVTTHEFGNGDLLTCRSRQTMQRPYQQLCKIHTAGC